MLKAVGKRGYILDIAHIAASEPASPEAPEAHIAAGTNQDTPLLQKIFDAFPSGALLLAADGRQIATNEQMALLLGIPRAELDAEAFTRLTGIALDAVGVEQEMRQVLDYPPGLEVIVRLCPLEAEEGGVFIVARQAGEAQESMQAQALFQEELFAGLQAHLVKPLMRIEQFLGNPDSSGLAQARAALERVNWFLGDLFLAQKTGIVPIDIEDYEER